jgi:VanZ family protein
MTLWTFLTRAQFFVLTGTATYLSLTPRPGAIFEEAPDKFLHLICWMVLLISLRIAMPRVRNFPWIALGLFAYSTLVEFGQMLVPGRFFSGGDIVANGVGVALGYLVVVVFQRGWRAYENRGRA